VASTDSLCMPYLSYCEWTSVSKLLNHYEEVAREVVSWYLEPLDNAHSGLIAT